MPLPAANQKTFCRSRDAAGKGADYRRGPEQGSNRTQNTAVNPLTRLASRSVMRGAFSAAAC